MLKSYNMFQINRMSTNLINMGSEYNRLSNNYQICTSMKKECSKDEVPTGSTLIGTEVGEHKSKKIIYTRTWRLPMTISISGIDNLPGNNWMSKLDKNFKDYISFEFEEITAFEIPNKDTVILHFTDKITFIRIKNILCKIAANFYPKLVITTA